MEIKVYLNVTAWKNHKVTFVRNLPEVVPNEFACLIRALKLLFGRDCIIEFVCV